MLVNILGVLFRDVLPISEKANVINPQKEWITVKIGKLHKSISVKVSTLNFPFQNNFTKIQSDMRKI